MGYVQKSRERERENKENESHVIHLGKVGLRSLRAYSLLRLTRITKGDFFLSLSSRGKKSFLGLPEATGCEERTINFACKLEMTRGAPSREIEGKTVSIGKTGRKQIELMELDCVFEFRLIRSLSTEKKHSERLESREFLCLAKRKKLTALRCCCNK